MKNFLIKGFGHFIGLILLLELVSTLFFFNTNVVKTLGINRGFYKLATIDHKSKNNITDTLHLGDSVARQLFHPSLSPQNLTTNAAVLMPGQYYLTANVIRNNPNLKSIYLGVTPGALRAETFGPKFIQNHIKPFVSLYNGRCNKDYIKSFFQTHPKTLLYTTSIGKYIPISEPKIEKRVDFTQLLSPTNKEYLKKINELCKANNISFHLYSPPVSIERKAKLKRLFSNMDFDSELQTIMINYGNTLRYIDKKHFKDQIHMTKKYLRTNKAKERNIILIR